MTKMLLNNTLKSDIYVYIYLKNAVYSDYEI